MSFEETLEDTEPQVDSGKVAEVSDDSLEELLYSNSSLDPKDFQGATLDDALDSIEGKTQLQRLAGWPNDAYRKFMELIIEGNISNKLGDKIIKFFNKHSNLEGSPLPKSTKNGKDYL
ncbi:8710_t:CDS:2, partial [Racocetra fulgida]